MASIVSIATAVPEHCLSTADICRALASLRPDARRLAAVSGDVSRVRYVAEPLEVLTAPRSIEERQAAYRKHALPLAHKVAKEALHGAGLPGRAIDLLITVSCTGFMIPSLDVYLAEDLGLRPDVVRLPVSQWGCSGGAAGLARAHDWLRAYPDRHVLVVAVELPSVTFQRADASIGNLVSSLVFGDGAGAAVLAGDVPGQLCIEDVAEILLPESTGSLGFELKDDGFHVVLDRDLPDQIAALLPPAVSPFLERWSDGVPSFAAIHAGGSRILDRVQQALNLTDDLLASSRRIFEAYGNVSSASILFVLSAEMPPAPPGMGLAIGIGPGISVQLLKLRR